MIETLVSVRRICEAYGATLSFRHASLPITCVVPSLAVVHEFTSELLNLLGIYTEVEGQTVTFTL